MKDKKILSLKEELEEAARLMDEEVAADPSVRGLKVPKEVDEQLAKRIAEYEAKKREAESAKSGAEHQLSEEDQKALEIGRQILAEKSPVVTTTGEIDKPHKIKHKKLLFALVAVLVLVCAFGVTSMGNHSYWKEVWEKMVGKQTVTVTNTKDSELEESEENDKGDVYQEINKNLGIVVVRLSYLPDGMYITKYDIDENQKHAKVLYKYDGNTISYDIYANSMDSSYAQENDDELIASYIEECNEQKIYIEEYKVVDCEEHRFIAKFSYKGSDYQLQGILKMEEFEKIIKSFYFF